MRTYTGMIKLLEACRGMVYVAVHYHPKGTYEWLPVERTEYLRQLRMIGNPDIPFPCYFDTDADENIYIHTRKENK